jgi:hypothetical protein
MPSEKRDHYVKSSPGKKKPDELLGFGSLYARNTSSGEEVAARRVKSIS